MKQEPQKKLFTKQTHWRISDGQVSFSKRKY